MASAAGRFHSRDDLPHFTRNLDGGGQEMLSCFPDETKNNGPQEESRFSVTLGKGRRRMTKPYSRARARLFNTAGLTLLSLAIGLPAMAQDVQEAQAVEEVIISGSRVIRDGSQAPTPVTVLGAEQLTTSSPRNIQEAIASLPAFNGSSGINTPVMAAGSNQVGGFLNLRGLGFNRTLVLLDGRRVAPQAGTGGVDFNLLPQALISRVDVVTGGASAAYGSDAVAGVVNVILDTNFRGVKGVLQGGISDKGDVGSYQASITTGNSYLDDRLRVMASATIRRNNPVYNGMSARSWFRNGYGRLTNPAGGTGTAAQQAWYFDINQRNYNGGVILAGTNGGNLSLRNPITNVTTSYQVLNAPTALQNTKFLPGGIVSPFDPGTSNTAANQVGGDGSRNNISLAGLLEAESYFARATFDLTPTTELYIQGMAATAHTRYEPSTNQFVQDTKFVVFEGNPFIPADIATRLAAIPLTSFQGTPAAPNGTPMCGYAFQTAQEQAAGAPMRTDIRCFRMARIFQEDYAITRVTGDALNDNFDLVAGFRTEIFGGYRFSGYVEHGEARFRTYTYGNNILERSYTAVDVISNPAVGGVPGVAAGAPVCRISVEFPSEANGCQPLNIFGYGAPSQAAFDWILGRSRHTFKNIQNVAALDIAGEPFQLPAGSVAFALGAEYRTLDVKQTVDPLQLTEKTGNFIRGYTAAKSGGPYYFTNQTRYAGEVSVKEIYTELDIPILRDLPLAESLSLNAAYRITDYSNSGKVNTYKIGLSYQPVESFRFRGTFSRDIRAPSPVELFSRSQGRANQVDPKYGTTGEVFTIGIGNLGLVPEEADTKAFGVVFTPTWIPGLTASVDWYDITLTDSIGQLGTPRILEECHVRTPPNTELCQYIVRDPATDRLTSVFNPFLNLNERKTAGIDVELGYRFEPTFIPGTLALRALLGYIDEGYTVAPGGSPVNDVGSVAGDRPRVKSQIAATYTNGPASLYLQANYIGHGYFSNTHYEGGWNVRTNSATNTVTDNTAGANVTFDLTGRYKFGEDQQYEAFLTVTNIFDKEPIIGTGSQNASNYTVANNSLYDTIGRYYTTGLRFRF